MRGSGRQAVVIVGDPDGYSLNITTALAMATLPHSPEARGGAQGNGGGNFFRGDPGYGVNRFAGKLMGALQTFGTPVAPINRPARGSVRYGMQAGPSQAPAYPSTGASSGFDALALMSGGALQHTYGRSS
jgi:hypothetical protein